MHRFLLHNGSIRNTREALVSPGQVGFMNGWGVFSTLRVCDGILFAFDRHYARMKRDAALVHVELTLDAVALEETLLSLVEANEAHDATLRVVFVRNRGGLFESPDLARKSELIAFTAPLANWNDGVQLSYSPNGRFAASPFAGVKVTSWAFNLTQYEEAHDRGFDEVLLLNERGEISECTSANVFAIYGNEVLTPPLTSSGCLPGVTRALLLEEVRVPGLTVREEILTPARLREADQVFITSSTRDLLPVLNVDREPLKQSPVPFSALRNAFREFRTAYVRTHARKQLSSP